MAGMTMVSCNNSETNKQGIQLSFIFLLYISNYLVPPINGLYMGNANNWIRH